MFNITHIYFFIPKSLGDAKINIMVESKDFRKGIHALEWWVGIEIMLGWFSIGLELKTPQAA